MVQPTGRLGVLIEARPMSATACNGDRCGKDPEPPLTAVTQEWGVDDYLFLPVAYIHMAWFVKINVLFLQ